MKPEKGVVGCVTCGTSLGCFLPIATLFGFVLIFAISNYFDETYYWEDADVWIVVVLTLVVVPAIFIGLIQAVIGIWSLFGFFDSDITKDDLNRLIPISYQDAEEAENSLNNE